MTGDEARRIRRALKLTQPQLAGILGLSEANGDRTVRAWEDGQKEVTGPASVALDYLAQGALDDTMRAVIPEYVAGEGLPEGEWELVIRLHAPRFLAAVLSAEIPPPVEWAWIEPGVERLAVLMWIDPPDLVADPQQLIQRAAALFQEYSLDALD